MEADPLYHVKQLFYQASYKACIAESTSQGITPSASEPSNLHRAIYVARSHLAFNPPQTSEALAALQPFGDGTTDSSSAAIKAVSAFAHYLAGNDREKRVEEVRDLVLEVEGGDGAEAEVEEGIVRVMAGSVFYLEKEVEEAVATLTEGNAKADLECNALLVQLLLSLDRRDLAQSTYAAAKKIGNDSTLVQAMEAWIGLKTGARPLHQSYYYYEELYQLPSGRTPPVLASHAAAHLLLSHVEEAMADVQEALLSGSGEREGDILAVATSLGLEGYAEKLASTAPNHPFAVDLEERSRAFDEAAAKFAVAA